MTDIDINIEQANEIEVEIASVSPITTSDHAQLTHLDYASSGHTGFASSTQLASETSARETADNTEKSARESADATLQANIDSEEEARESADSTLQTNINAEATSRANADTTLDGKISLRALITESGNKIDLEINSSTYELVAKLYDKNDNLISTSSTIDLPLETMVVSATYDSTNKKIIFTLKNGTTLDVPVGDLISGLASETYVDNKVSTEATARSSADTTLQTNIDNEETARENADSTLQTNINTEASSRESADETLQDNIDEINAKIPTDASSSNQLADKTWVNQNAGKIDSISINGATQTIVNKNVDLPAYPTKTSLGLSNVDNTSDANKPISSATQTAINNIINGTTPVSKASGYTEDGETYEALVSLQANITAEATARANADSTLQANINNEATARTNADTSLGNRITAIENDYLKASDKTSLQNQITANADDIDAIEEKIPSQATSQNQLADKNFVNSSIATNTAYFLGTLDVVDDLGLSYGATTSQVVTALNSYTFTSKTNNDYCFVINKDGNNNLAYQRYKYVSSSTTFEYEYTLNNSSFTASQWSAINSGITDTLVGKITSNETAISSEATARANADTTLQDNIDAEETRAEGVESGLDSRLDTIEADYLKASDKTALQSQITANANDIDTIEQSSVMQSGITQSKVSEITSNTSARHTHSNKSVLDGITQTQLDKIATNESNITSLSNAKADKVSSATNGNFAGLDSNGNLTDSGYDESDFLQTISYITLSGTSGTLSSSDLTTLQASRENKIILDNEVYILQGSNSTYLTYTHTSEDSTNNFYIKCIAITISTRGWVKSSRDVGGDIFYKDYTLEVKTVAANGDASYTIALESDYYVISVGISTGPSVCDTFLIGNIAYTNGGNLRFRIKNQNTSYSGYFSGNLRVIYAKKLRSI